MRLVPGDTSRGTFSCFNMLPPISPNRWIHGWTRFLIVWKSKIGEEHDCVRLPELEQGETTINQLQPSIPPG